MLIDLTCPAEVFRTVLPTEDSPAVSLTLYNLSDRVIASVEVTVRMLSASGAEKEKMAFRGRALNGRPHSTFSMNVPMAPAAGIRSAEVEIDKVWYSDNDVWRREEGAAVEYTPNSLPVSNALTRLKYVAGETAVGYPDQQEGLWVCVCGRANPEEFTACARCRREKRFIFAQYNRETVENQIALREKQLDLSTRSAREDTARLQRIREEEYNRNKARRNRRIRLAVCLAVCLLLAAILAGGVMPALRVVGARQAMEDGNYGAALETLHELSAFPGAEDQIRECNRQIAAREAAESEDPDILTAAAALLRADEEGEAFRNAADLADLRRAEILLSGGDAAGARRAMSSVPEDNAERQALEADCLFLDGCNALDEQRYSAAREIFLSLGDYEGAAALASECIYRPAVEMISAGRYDDAISLLNRIPDYQDSRRLTLQCHYMNATVFEAAEDYASAASEYLLADDWEDAPDKTKEMIYRLARAAFDRNDLAEAQRLYSSVPGYLDADSQNRICLYELGKNAFRYMEYTMAYEWLSGLPENYTDDSDDMRIQAAYLAGRNALNQGNAEKAIPLLTAAGNYKDAEKLLVQAIEMLAAAQPAPSETPEPEAYDPAEYAVEGGE